jgi:hypothetical protein
MNPREIGMGRKTGFANPNELRTTFKREVAVLVERTGSAVEKLERPSNTKTAAQPLNDGGVGDTGFGLDLPVDANDIADATISCVRARR